MDQSAIKIDNKRNIRLIRYGGGLESLVYHMSFLNALVGGAAPSADYEGRRESITPGNLPMLLQMSA